MSLVTNRSGKKRATRREFAKLLAVLQKPTDPPPTDHPLLYILGFSFLHKLPPPRFSHQQLFLHP